MMGPVSPGPAGLLDAKVDALNAVESVRYHLERGEVREAQALAPFIRRYLSLIESGIETAAPETISKLGATLARIVPPVES